MKELSVAKAEELVEFAFTNNAVVEQKEFNQFDRCVILTTRGLVGLRTPKNHEEQEIAKPCELSDFHGFDTSIQEIKSKFTMIRLDNYHG